MSSKAIDEKVVEMRFDNKGFESNVQTSIKSLEQLKKGLNLEESAKGLHLRRLLSLFLCPIWQTVCRLLL